MGIKENKQYKRANEDASESIPHKKKRLEFCVSSFRKKLKKEECYEALEKFVRVCQGASGEDDPAVQYLKGGGQMVEILRILDSNHDHDLSHVSIVFSALQVLLLRALTEVPESRKSMEESCHHLLNSYLSDVHRLLSVRSSAHHKKVVLQLLTAMVTLSTTLARDVLSYVSLSTDVVDNIVKLIRPDDPKSVRICFVQFLTAFLVEGNPSVISLLLDKRLILTSIIRGMRYDPSHLVTFVITTLRTKLVETTEISKTQKIHTFNTRVMCDLLSLYKWKGPAAFAQDKKGSSKVCLEGDPHHREAVAEAVHSLLLALCTSYRYGVVFHDHMLGTKSRINVLVSSVLKELERPWENPLLTDLVVQIACVCPELAPISYSRVAPVLEPRTTKHWLRAASFVTQLLSVLKLSELASLEPHSALATAKVLAASRHIVSPIVSGALHDHPAVRHKTMQFLQAELSAVGASLAALAGQQAADFQLHVMKILPNAVVLEQCWRKALRNPTSEKSPPITDEPNPSPTEQMLTLVDLMFLYQKYLPLLLDAHDTSGSLTTTLSRVLSMEDLANENLLSLQLKVLQLLTQLDTSVLEPGQTGFVAAISILLRASCKSDPLSADAQCTLGNLLAKCQVLEPAAADMTGEMGIWLQSCQIVNPSQRPTIISFLQKVLIDVATNPVAYLEQSLKVQDMIVSTSDTGKMKIQMDQADYLFRELLGIADVEKSHLKDIKKNGKQISEPKNRENFHVHDFLSTVTLSPVLLYVDSMWARESLDTCVVKYLASVLVHLLHLQADPRPFLSVVKNWTVIPSAVLDYLKSWDTETPLVLTKPFGTGSLETSVSRVLLGRSKHIPELEECSNPIVILKLLRMAAFYVVQLAERQQLTETVTSLGLDVSLALLHALKEVLSQEEPLLSQKCYKKCFSLILKHPVLLCYFSPLHKTKQTTENLVTDFMLSFLEQISGITSPEVVKDASVLLKEKLLRNILYYLERSKQAPTNTLLLLRTVKTSALSGPETCSLMPKLIEKMMMQPWTALTCYLLCTGDGLPMEQVISLGNKLTEHLQVDVPSATAWELADSFQLYLQRFPHCVYQVPSGLFQVSVCERGLNLASILLHHQSSYVMELITLVKQNDLLVSPQVLFPLLLKASHHGPLPHSLLEAVYNQYEKELCEAVQPPFSAATCFSNYVDVMRQLIVNCMGSEKCRSSCKSLAQDWKNLGLCTPFSLTVLHSLQIKGGWRKLAVEFIQILVHQLKEMLQTHTPSSLISQLCSLLREHLIDHRIKWRKIDLQSIENWDSLPVLVLQSGLSGLDRHLTCCLFSTFAQLLWRAKETKMAAQVFEMTISHSRFFDIILTEEHAGEKLAVLQLILICYELAPHVMKASQVPIWLGAYGATLSHGDQVTLKILHCLNNSGNVNLNAFRPFLWGEAAINHYSVRSRAGMSLWRVPHASVALELLQLKMIENTIAKFPMHRKLMLKEQDNLCESDNFIIGSVEDLEPSQPDVYDPAFIIPLLSHVLAPESVVQERKFSRFGGLALTLVALGSKCGYMRTSALSVLSRFHDRLNPKTSNAQLDEQFIESIRAGIGNLKTCQGSEVPQSTAKKSKLKAHDASTDVENDNSSGIVSPQQAPVVPNLYAVFLARASMVLTQPLHKLFKPLSRFFLAKPALDLKTVPDLIELLRPDSVDFRAYQLWLLKTLQYGMQTEDDVANARSRHLFKMLFALYSSPLSDVQARILILHLVEATLQVNNGCALLLKSGILPMLHGAVNSLEKEEDGDLIIGFIRVIAALKEHAHSVGSAVAPLLLKLPPAMKSTDIQSVLQVALKLIHLLSQDHLVVLLCLCQRVLDSKTIDECNAQLGLPKNVTIKTIECVETNDTSGRYKDNISVTEQAALTNNLKQVVHQWLSHKCDFIEIRT